MEKEASTLFGHFYKIKIKVSSKLFPLKQHSKKAPTIMCFSNHDFNKKYIKRLTFKQLLIHIANIKNKNIKLMKTKNRDFEMLLQLKGTREKSQVKIYKQRTLCLPPNINFSYNLYIFFLCLKNELIVKSQHLRECLNVNCS